jgi:uncharacterized SAM-binding protein YcdF (DUF218 family)
VRRFFLRLLVAVLVLGAGLYASRRVWLSALGSALVDTEPPAPSDAILVLAGDYTGARLFKGAELARAGIAPKVYVSGPDGFYGHSESELAIEFARSRGYPAALFIPLVNAARSTADEAALLVPRLKREGVRSLVIVTSTYHTGRAGRLFRAAAGDALRIRVVAAEPEEDWRYGWWTVREGRKMFVYEWIKTVTSWLGI